MSANRLITQGNGMLITVRKLRMSPPPEMSNAIEDVRPKTFCASSRHMNSYPPVSGLLSKLRSARISRRNVRKSPI